MSNFLHTLISRIFSISIQNRQTQKKFCQIIMGSPLNSNVPEGRSVFWCQFTVLSSATYLLSHMCLLTCSFLLDTLVMIRIILFQNTNWNLIFLTYFVAFLNTYLSLALPINMNWYVLKNGIRCLVFMGERLKNNYLMIKFPPWNLNISQTSLMPKGLKINS